MKFAEVAGHNELKNKLTGLANNERVGHALLFYGPEGNGALPLSVALAQYLSCQDKSTEDSCGKCLNCKLFASNNYPDIHFVYPVAKTQKSSDKPLSSDFREEWNSLLKNEKYFGLFRWLETLGVENKQAQISVHESADILKKLSLKSYGGKYKFVIIWMPERMNNSASNKILKILEEPPAYTFFFLVSEDPDSLLQTITSRCQKIQVNRYSLATTKRFLIEEEELDENAAAIIAQIAEGNLSLARKLSERSESYKDYAVHFSSWVRACFKADTHQILSWVDECGRYEREKLKDFIKFCSDTFRQAFNLNYSQPVSTNQVFDNIGFELSKFAPFVNSANASEILSLIDTAEYDVSRNANPKIVLTDLSLKMARQLRIKA